MAVSLDKQGKVAIIHLNRPPMNSYDRGFMDELNAAIDELRFDEDLGAAVDDMSLQLMEDQATGVMAGVYHMSGQIQEALGRAVPSPIEFDPAPQVVPLSGE